jgi:hypothetical protein
MLLWDVLFNSWVQVVNNILQVKGQLQREHAQL